MNILMNVGALSSMTSTDCPKGKSYMRLSRAIFLSLAAMVAVSGLIPCFGADRQDNQTFNVLNFGAKGNGVTDDRPAIQKAMNAAISGAGNTLVFPAGHTFVIGNGDVRLQPCSGLRIVIDGNLIKKANPRDSRENPGSFFSTVTSNQSYDYKDLTFTGKGVLDGNCREQSILPEAQCGQASGIFLAGIDGLKMEGLTVKNVGGWAVNVHNCKNIDIAGMKIYQAGGNNLHVGGKWLSGGNCDGIHLCNCIDFAIHGCYAEATDAPLAFTLLKATMFPFTGTVFGNGKIYDNVIAPSSPSGSGPPAVQISDEPDMNEPNKVAGNDVYARNIVVSNNKIICRGGVGVAVGWFLTWGNDNGRKGFRDIVVTDNEIIGANTGLVPVGPYTGRPLFHRGQFTNMTLFAAVNVVSASRVTVANNRFSGCTGPAAMVCYSDDVTIEKNLIEHWKPANYGVAADQPEWNAAISIWCAGEIDKIFVRDNQFKYVNGYAVAMLDENDGRSKGEFVLENNTFYKVNAKEDPENLCLAEVEGEKPADAMIVKPSSPSALLLQGMGRITVKDNVFEKCDGPLIATKTAYGNGKATEWIVDTNKSDDAVIRPVPLAADTGEFSPFCLRFSVFGQNLYKMGIAARQTVEVNGSSPVFFNYTFVNRGAAGSLRPFNVFVHVVDGAQLVAVCDYSPSVATKQWRKGRAVFDENTAVDLSQHKGKTLKVYVGLYEPNVATFDLANPDFDKTTHRLFVGTLKIK